MHGNTGNPEKDAFIFPGAFWLATYLFICGLFIYLPHTLCYDSQHLFLGFPSICSRKSSWLCQLREKPAEY